MEWKTFSAGKNQDDVQLHQKFLQGGKQNKYSFTYEIIQAFENIEKEDVLFCQYLNVYRGKYNTNSYTSKEDFCKMILEKIFRSLKQMKLVNPPFAVDYNTNVMNIQATPDLRKYAIIHVSIEGRYINIDIIDVNLDINMQIYIDAIKKILNSMFSVIESIQSLEKLFITHPKFYENHNILYDTFQRPDPDSTDTENALSKFLLFNFYTKHADLITKQIKFINGKLPNTEPLTGRRLKELLEETLMNADLPYF